MGPSPRLVLAGLTSALVASPLASAQAALRPRLVVLVVVDQLTTEHLTRYRPLLRGGLGRLLRRGAFYPNGRFAYASTETGPGHATLATGAWPHVHGVVGNRWVDRTTGALVRCVEDRQHGNSPHYLMAPGIADAMKLATRGRSRVVSLGLKPRASVLLGGTRPDVVVWYDHAAGRLTPGRWPGVPEPPEWYRSAVSKTGPLVAVGGQWTRLRPDLDYAAWSSADDRPVEKDVPGLGRTFPHPLGTAPKQWPRQYPATPPALDDLMALAEAAVVGAELGADDAPDLLALGLSGFDYVGHWYGPDSQESLDALLRIDAALGALLEGLDRRLGGGQVLTVVTSDHGVMPIPEVAAAHGVTAGRFGAASLAAVLKGQLRDAYPTRVYLQGSSRPTAPASTLSDRRGWARRLSEQPALLEAFVPEDLARVPEPYRTFYRRVLVAGRQPDIFLRPAPLQLMSQVEADGTGHGTSHGSPYLYDQTVPIVVAGPRVAAKVDRDPVMMTRVAPTIAAVLGIEPPAAAYDAPLPAVTR